MNTCTMNYMHLDFKYVSASGLIGNGLHVCARYPHYTFSLATRCSTVNSAAQRNLQTDYPYLTFESVTFESLSLKDSGVRIETRMPIVHSLLQPLYSLTLTPPFFLVIRVLLVSYTYLRVSLGTLMSLATSFMLSYFLGSISSERIIRGMRAGLISQIFFLKSASP